MVSQYADLPVIQTETPCGNNHWESDFNPDRPPNDHAYGMFTWGKIREFLEAGVNSYNAWNMVLDIEGKSIDSNHPWPQNALIVVDRNAGTFRATAAYYAFRHFSSYVNPGAVRVGVSGGQGNAVAFKNPDGRYIIVVQNSGQQQTMAVQAGDTTVSFDIPANGWATVRI